MSLALVVDLGLAPMSSLRHGARPFQGGFETGDRGAEQNRRSERAESRWRSLPEGCRRSGARRAPSATAVDAHLDRPHDAGPATARRGAPGGRPRGSAAGSPSPAGRPRRRGARRRGRRAGRGPRHGRPTTSSQQREHARAVPPAPARRRRSTSARTTASSAARRAGRQSELVVSASITPHRAAHGCARPGRAGAAAAAGPAVVRRPGRPADGASRAAPGPRRARENTSSRTSTGGAPTRSVDARGGRPGAAPRRGHRCSPWEAWVRDGRPSSVDDEVVAVGADQAHAAAHVVGRDSRRAPRPGRGSATAAS